MAFTDDFTETSDTNLEDHTPSGGTAWTLASGSAGAIYVKGVSDAIVLNASADAVYLCDDQGSADHYVQAVSKTVASLGTGRLCVRLQDNSNFVGWSCVSNAADGGRLRKRVGGTLTSLIAYQAVVDDVVKVVANSTTLQLWVNGSQVGTDQTVSDFSTETSTGFVVTGSAANDWLDDFEAGALSSGVSGTLAATESGSDTAAVAGDVPVDGSLAATESGSDTAALAGDVLVQGALAATESGADTAAATGIVLVQGTLAATESGADTCVITSSATATGTLAATESGSDAAALVGDVLVQGTQASTESGADTAALAGNIYISGVLAATDSADVAALAGNIYISGALAATESGSDTASLTSSESATPIAIWAIPFERRILTVSTETRVIPVNR